METMLHDLTLLVLSITSYSHYNIWGCMCSTGPFQYRWLKWYIYSSGYYHYQIESIHLSHCYHIFSVVVCLRCLLHHILLLIAYTYRENREFAFIIIVQLMINVNHRIRFVLKIVFVCLYITPFHYHHCANLSEDIELIKCLSDIFCRVREKDKAYSLLSIIQYVGLCVFSLPISLVIEIIYIYFILLSSSNQKYVLLPIVYG